MRRLLDELVDGVSRGPPVRIDQRPLDRQGTLIVLAGVGSPEQLASECGEACVHPGHFRQIGERVGEGRAGVARGEVGSILARVCAVVDDRPAERIIPPRDHVEEDTALHVDTAGESSTGRGHDPSIEPIQFRGDRVGIEVSRRFARRRASRFILVLCGERDRIVEVQIHRVLYRTRFVRVVPLEPCRFRTLIQGGSIGEVVRSRIGEASTLAQPFRPDAGVFLPCPFVGRHSVDQFRSLALPFGRSIPVDGALSEVARADDGAGHDRGDLATRASEP